MRLLTLIRTACLFLAVAILTVAGTVRAADPRPTETASTPHPAQTYIDRAAAAVRARPEDSVRDTQAALKILANQPNADLEIRARLLLCDHLSERDKAAAEAEVAKARALLPRATRRGLEAGVLNCEGTILETVSENARARELYEQAVAVATRAQDDEMLAASLFARGYLLGLQGQYATGLADLKRGQALYEELDLPHHSLTALNGIAILYNRMGDYAQARYMYDQALKVQREAGMYREQGVTLHNLGRAHENLREWDAAQAAFQESYDINRQLNYPRGEAYALRGLAAVKNAKGDPNGALQTLEQAMVLQRQTPDARLNAQIQLARGVALHRLRQLPASAEALQAALGVFRQADSLSELRATYGELAAVLSDMGDWREGYAHLLNAQETSERMFRNQVDQRFATLKVEFDTAAKEKENALLVRENNANQLALAEGQRARNWQRAVIVLTVVLIVLLGILAWHQWRSTRRMRTLAMTDELTGVPNRRAVLTRLAPLLQQPNPPSCAMLIIDIDHFKSINDQHGHAEGDEALKAVARELREDVHEPAFIGRLGGEEFVVAIPGADYDRAYRLAERFRESVMSIDTRRWLNDRRITVSIGLTMAKSTGDTPSTMLQRADAALYDAKRAGRNCVKVQLPAPESEAPAPMKPGQVEFA
ncbi:diguanylate cyclase [Steroidobacter agaridevorans]|uniref:diguanylate cyclase n=1 Tax=Steroidobacter agaridevorans TaxID=2695856 RepID=UPI00132AA6D3|nr:diguanylate cyclase [Steroidobacter agaridevorans]GFE86847.1 GGDEF domain-containing protein [Steroidobacter agaridevorans]